MTRGEIYYIRPDDGMHVPVGSETRSGRPGIIVSNDRNNNYAPFVLVVFLTTRSKKLMPTHVGIQSSGVPSTACCEQIHTVDKSRIGALIGTCTEAEMRAVNAALTLQLALDQTEAKQKYDFGPAVEVTEHAIILKERDRLVAMETERDTYKRLYEDLMAKLIRKVRKYDQGNSI